MSRHTFDRDRFEALPLVGILRSYREDQIRGIVAAAIRGGLTNLEITMNTDGAAAQIRTAIDAADGALNIGAGTVTTMGRFEAALEAGAGFIVTPSIIDEVLAACRRMGLPVIPGAFSPTEVWNAWRAGALRVKLFPAELGGPAYVKTLKGPLPEVRLLPTGGVHLESMAEYIAAGAEGFGLGGTLFDKAQIEAGNWSHVETQVRIYRETFMRARSG